MKTARTRLRLLASTAAITLVAALPAAAADNSGAATQLDEIIVTAQKRSEDVTKVPTSISVVGGDALGSSGIKDYDDLTRAVPGISFAAGGAGNGVGEGNSVLEMRGISSPTSSVATVGVYLDEMSVTNGNRYVGASQPVPLDINRVEILRGPQGTLYGASSEAGTIRFIHNRPDLNTFSGFIAGDVSGTEHGGVNYQTSSVVNVPIDPGIFAVRVGGLYGGDSGWIDNYNLDGSLNKRGVNSDITKALRVDGLYQPSELFSAEAQVNYQRVDSKDSPIFYLGSQTIGYPPVTQVGGLFKQSKEVAEPTADTVLTSNLDLVANLGFADLTSVTSYFWRAMEMITDATFFDNTVLAQAVFPPLPNGNYSSAVALAPVQQFYPVEFQTYTQEFRLSSPSGTNSPLKWVGGLYFSRSEQSYLNNEPDYSLPAAYQAGYGQPISTQNPILGLPPSAGNSVWINGIYSQNTRTYTYEYAGFGQIDYDITPKLHFSTGVRYQFTRLMYDALTQGFFTAVPYYKDHSDSFSTTPRFSLSYDLTDTSSAYTTIAKGYRIGGEAGPLPVGNNAADVCLPDYNSFGISSTNPPQDFHPDSLWSYEAGVKSTMANRTLSINADGYYIDWSNIQQSINLPTCGYNFTSNVGDAESYGGELELRYAPPIVKGLKLGLSTSINHSTLTKVFVPFATVGQDVLYAPSLTANVSVDYEVPLRTDFNGFVHADYDWTGHSHGSFDNALPNYEDLSYGVLNASFGIDTGTLKISIYAKNLLNDHTIIQKPTVNSVTEGYTVRPLTAGITARQDF